MNSFLHIKDEEILKTRINTFVTLHIFPNDNQKKIFIEQIRISFLLGEPIYGNKNVIRRHSITS
jgi:hypothetical protein